MYVNGELAGTDTFSGSGARQLGGSLRIGKRNDGYFVNGLVDGARVYTTTLTLAQIQKLYAEGLKTHQFTQK